MKRPHLGIQGSPIVVVGSPRSGTTWLGDLLEASPKIHQVYEPFNRWSPDPFKGVDWPFSNQFVPYVGRTQASHEWEPATRRLMRQQVPPRYFGRTLASHLRRGQVAEWSAPVLNSISARMRGSTLLIKDPRATHLAEWLAGQFNSRIVYMVRHPCGVVAGAKRMGWRFQAAWLLQNEPLMRELLDPIRDELEVSASEAHDVIACGIGMWNAYTWPLVIFKNSIADLAIVDYDELAINPAPNLVALCETLGIHFDRSVSARLSETTTGSTVTPLSNEQHVLVRKSSDVASSWQTRLTDDEVERVMEGTAKVRETMRELGFSPEWS